MARDLIEQIGHVESGSDPKAKNPLSSAAGLFGFTDGTWVEQAKQALPEAEGRSRAEIIKLRDNPEAQKKVMEHWTAGNIRALQRHKLPVSAANIYAVHFAGRGGGPRVLKAPDTEKLSTVLSPAAMRANRVIKFEGRKFADWTVGDFKRWIEKKMAGVTVGQGES